MPPAASQPRPIASPQPCSAEAELWPPPAHPFRPITRDSTPRVARAPQAAGARGLCGPGGGRAARAPCCGGASARRAGGERGEGAAHLHAPQGWVRRTAAKRCPGFFPTPRWRRGGNPIRPTSPQHAAVMTMLMPSQRIRSLEGWAPCASASGYGQATLLESPPSAGSSS